MENEDDPDSLLGPISMTEETPATTYSCENLGIERRGGVGRW
ncbi:hypothetical protein CXB51_012607 [Gossypium anomalum]|uniref:Uncharacterized protein n=1 Tax=Gossypium anomalum TaxID=47600 RepID=A0A8J6D895_9ROSI|nr:hypothetical protein CXB51_012607 [Gossypium anomalum]